MSHGSFVTLFILLCIFVLLLLNQIVVRDLQEDLVCLTYNHMLILWKLSCFRGFSIFSALFRPKVLVFSQFAAVCLPFYFVETNY